MAGFTRKISRFMFATLSFALCLAAALAASAPGSNGSPTPLDTTVIDEDTTMADGLVLDGDMSMRVENCSLDVEGGVTVKGGARLTLRNAEIRLVEPEEAEPPAHGYWFDVQGDSVLEMVNVSIETAFFRGFRIRVSDRAELRLRGVYSMDWYGLTCRGGSTVSVEDSTCWSTFNMGDDSTLTASGSRVYGVNVTDYAEARLEGVYATTASVIGGGSLHIQNSTISSETRGLIIGLGEEAELTFAGFPASPTGIDYWHLDDWSLAGGDVAALNVTLDDVYFRNVRLDAGRGADLEMIDVDAPLEVTCSGDVLSVKGSFIDGVKLEGGCDFSAEDVSLSWLEAWTQSTASLKAATVQRSELHNRSVASYVSSTVGSLSSGDAAVVFMCGSSLPEDLLVAGDSAVIHFSQPVSAALLGYDSEEGALEVGLEGLHAETELTVVLDRDRVRSRSGLGVLLDGEQTEYRVVDEKGLSYVSLRVSPGVARLSVDLGAPPPERVPFLETLVGQRLVTLLLVLLLVVFVLLTWR